MAIIVIQESQPFKIRIRKLISLACFTTGGSKMSLKIKRVAPSPEIGESRMMNVGRTGESLQYYDDLQCLEFKIHFSYSMNHEYH